MTSGLDVSSSGYSRKFAYPLYVQSTAENDPGAGTMGITGIIDRSKNVLVLGSPVFPSGLESFHNAGAFDGFSLVTRQNGSSGYSQNEVLRTGTSYGATEQVYVFAGVKGGVGVGVEGGMVQVPFGIGTEPLFSRRVLAVNGSVARDSLQKAGGGVIGKGKGSGEKVDVQGVFAVMDDGDLVGGKIIHGM